MPVSSSLRRGMRASPLGVFLTVLCLTFVLEGIVMVVLPLVGPWPMPAIGETLTDATLLSAALAPALWYVVLRPWRELTRARGELLQRVFEVQETERRRVGRDLHDELGQHLTALVVHLRALEQSTENPAARERAGELVKVAAGTLAQVRRLAHGMRPEVLEDFGLVVAVERLCEDFRATHALDVELRVAIAMERRFGSALELAAYRLIQEALTNIARHAGARRVEVAIAEHPGRDRRLEIVITDDGKGIDTDRAKGPSMGLQSMRERAELLRGSFSIRPGPSGGTIVEASIPLVEAP